ncbi:MAG: hypothetical protein ACLQJR_34840 [Stellaceae bacterium]
MIGLSRRFLYVARDAVTGMLRLAGRRCFLMRGMFVIVVSEMLRLPWRTFAIARHEFS